MEKRMGIENVLGYEEIKGVLHVKEKERDTFVQTREEQKKNNQEKLQYMRAISEDMRRDVAFHRSGGKHVVSKIFVTRPKEKPLMKGKSLEDSAKLMDQRAFEVSRAQGKITYQLDKEQQQLKEKQKVLDELKDLLEDNPMEHKIKEYLELQSKAELVKMQNDEAINTCTSYKKIIYALKKEIFDTSQNIKRQTLIKKEKVSIVNDIKGIEDVATTEFKQVQRKMKPLQTMIETKTREFDESLRKKKKEYVDQRRDTTAKCMGELKMDIVEDENHEERKRKELETNVELKSYNDVFEELKGALDISNVKDVLHRVQEESARHQRLCNQLDESNVMYDVLYGQLEDLRTDLGDLTYHPEPPGMSEQEEERLKKDADTQMQRVEDAVSRLKEKERVIAGIKLAAVAIHSKLIYVRLTSDKQCTLVGDPAKDMEMIWNKAEKLRSQFENWNMEDEEHDRLELQKYMEMRLPEDNLRTTMRPLDYRSRDHLRYDLNDTQASYVSRDDIKKRHQDIIKPKKHKAAGGAAGRKGAASGRGKKL